MEEKIKELEAKIAELNLKVISLEERVKDLEDGSISTGVYLEGVPDYAKEYIQKSNKEGE